MLTLTEKLSGLLSQAFEKAGYDKKYAAVRYSDRPDLCEFQCNGAMAAAKAYHKAPFMIADEVLTQMPENDLVERIEVVKPGFINLDIREEYLTAYLTEIAGDEHLSIPQTENPKTIIMDYGGPNVAKPLHVGHLRSAVIGEAVKRMKRSVGHQVLGDIHMGDWGLQMGLIITEMQERQPELPYFDSDFKGTYPEEAPFTISELEEIYPTASGKSKQDEVYREKALEATYQLQIGNRGYRELWHKIMEVSVADLKKNYSRLNVSFDLWKAESDAQPYIPPMIQAMKDKGILHESEGAMVVDVCEESDSKEIPPCIIQKSDGASLYATTDLATLVMREEQYRPDEVLYVVDKRQEMHFTQVFRTARKAEIVRPETKLTFLGFGTMNGRDGKPFKTREGGVMRLEMLLSDIYAEMEKKIRENRNVKDEDTSETASIVGLSAVKYGDLSNQATKDYIFDIDKFTSFEGNTGPYILYTIVRMKSILAKYDGSRGTLISPKSEAEKSLMLKLTRFGSVVNEAAEELAPHKICAYIFGVANDFNRFYHDTRILQEENEEQKASWIGLLELTKSILEKAIDILGFSAPEHM